MAKPILAFKNSAQKRHISLTKTNHISTPEFNRAKQYRKEQWILMNRNQVYQNICVILDFSVIFLVSLAVSGKLKVMRLTQKIYKT